MRADAQRNYEALLSAARDLFLEQGPDAPLDEVAKRAGVGAGTLYRHFPTRNDLVAAIYVTDIEAMCDAAEKLAAAERPGDALADYMDMYLTFGMRNNGIKKAIKEMLATEGPHPEGLTLCKSRMMDIAEELLDHAQKAGAARSGMDAFAFQRMLHGITLACDDNPDLAPSMLKVMKDGLLTAA